MDVATAFDSNYAPYAAALIRSLSFYSSQPIRLHIIVPNQQREHEAILKIDEEFRDCWNVDLYFYSTPILQDLQEKQIVTDVGYININTYSKLFFASLLPTSIDRIVYIDPDAFVRRDPSVLFNYRLSRSFGACLENKPWADKLFGTPDALYFNAGVFITSLADWRENGILERCLEVLQDFGQTHFMDQDVLNRVFKNNFEVLPKTFNTFGDDYFTLGVLENLSNPLVVHFAGGNKPWSDSRKSSPWTEEWDQFGKTGENLRKKFNPYVLFRYRTFRFVWGKTPLGFKRQLKNISKKLLSP